MNLRLVVRAAAGVLCLLLAVVGFLFVLDRTACRAGERRAFAEVPHYGGVRLRPAGNADASSCMAIYRATAPEAPVLAWYQQALRASGWTLDPSQAQASRDPQGRELHSGELHARRGGYTFTLLYETGPALEGGGTHVAVHVAGD